ncbi:MAG: hypothetical protein ACYC25_02085 [Paludibacter sp.]
MDSTIDYQNLILANLWMILVLKIICLIIGFVIIKYGQKMIYAGIKGEYNFSVNYKGIKGGIISSSPGLLFLIFGGFLICYALYVHKEVKFVKQPTYKQMPDIEVQSDTLNFKF